MDNDEDIEYSPSGNPVYRHKTPERMWEPAFADSKNIDLVTAHIEKHIGPVDKVFHELISDMIHVDVHIVNPTPQRNVYTLVTSGMSDRPMTTHPNLPECAWSELMICLPPDWPMSNKEWNVPANFWPVQNLKFLACFPHQFNTWLG